MSVFSTFLSVDGSDESLVIKPVSFNFLLFLCLIPILKSQQNAFISIIMYFSFAFVFEMWALKPGI